MDVASAIRKARHRAGLTQRALAARTGVAQPTIARIEQGKGDPRLSTVERLLRACGETIEAMPQLGVGIDQTEIDELLDLTPAQRLASLVQEQAAMDRLSQSRRIG
ncbi:MAG TPA: helix-turn-helix domain-containing protein [Acidimicrobiales bacterium]|nr:helix-turn-helix domain-containing protein [Acidimicrobiales bacterium]